jgi:NAD(P)-dependent dehydrogenase (short-subunit alcohol dehydrogenase family)
MDCRDRTFAEITAASGSLPLFLDEDRFGKKFPGLFDLLPCRESAELLATTRLIGMECPGKHSIYSGHSVYFRDHGKDQPQQLDYEVTRTDPRFSMIWMRVAGMIMDGTVTAFARPRPQDQAPVATVCKLVKEDEFVTARALVVGGSRGLGEITAKIIAAGGGDVWITYHRGEKDAERVAGEIRDAGLKCSYSGFDVTAPLTSLPGQLGGGWKPNQLYYFPTPAISFETQQLFSAEKFDSYCRFYVDGFASTLAWLLRLGAKPLSVFYPSTIFLEQFEEHSTEYCAAKAAGEVLCRHLARLPGIDIYAPRLERMTTDQTSRLLPVDAVDSLAAMLTAIRARPVRP